MKRVFLVILYMLFCLCPCFAIEDTVSVDKKHSCGCDSHQHDAKIEVNDGDFLTVRDCISIGLQNSPIIKEYAYKLEIAKSNVGLAKSMFFPVFSVGAGYNQTFNSNKDIFYRNYRELPYVGVALNQMIWDFGKTTANIRMEDFLRIAAEYEFEDSVCLTVFDIKKHYYNLLKEKYYYEIEKINLELQEYLIPIIREAVRKNMDISSALPNSELDLGKIKIKVKEAETRYANAKEDLNNSMFLKNAPDFLIYDTQTFVFKPVAQKVEKKLNYNKKDKVAVDDTIFKYEKYDYDNAVQIAYNNSPDIRALVATKNAMEQALISIKRNYYPELKAGVRYDFVNSNKYSNNGLNVAVGVDSSLNAMRQKYDVKGAKAQLNFAETEITTFKDNLYFKVRKNINDLDTAYKNLSTYKNNMSLAAKYFEKIMYYYELGKTDHFELVYSKDVYIDAIKAYINSQYAYNIALINLEMSMHEHLADYHDNAEHAVKYHVGDEGNAMGKLIRCKKKHKQ